MNVLLKKAASAIALLSIGMGVANADPILVDPTSSGSSVTVTINEADCHRRIGCSVWTDLSDNLNNVAAWLDIGSSTTFDFFDIFVGGLGEVLDATVNATLAFSSPGSTVVASGNGSFFTFFGIFSGGSLTWNQPGAINLSDGTSLSVNFENLHEIGFGNHTTVSATVHRYGELIDDLPNGDHVTVAEPGTLALLGLALLGLGLAKRRRKTS